MSRFYRALQEASRTVTALTENAAVAGDGVKSERDAAPILDYAEPIEPIAPANIRLIETDAGSETRAQVLPAAGSQNGSLGISAKVTLEQGAPLLPHAVDGVVVEYYRRLRAKIIQEQERKPFRSLLVTSPAPEDGKSVTALNLALTFGMLPGYQVLLVDGDLRRGRLGKMLGADDRPGLNNLIEGSAELEDVVLKCDEIPVNFMVRGSATTPPGELLHSSRLIPQFRKMSERFSLVLVDSPPVNLVADAQLLAAGCDAVLLVARAFATSRKALQKTVLDLNPFRVIGTVLNCGMRADLYRHYKYYK
jgi:capsular exopolysaccharide synthesis family protein